MISRGRAKAERLLLASRKPATPAQISIALAHTIPASSTLPLARWRLARLLSSVFGSYSRSGGGPAAFDAAGAGNVAWSRCCDTSQPKGRGNREHKLRPKPARQSPTLPMSGERRRSVGQQTPPPRLSSTLPLAPDVGGSTSGARGRDQNLVHLRSSTCCFRM
jgi:hypothetical protein